MVNTVWYHGLYHKYGLKYGAAFIHTISKTDQAFFFFEKLDSSFHGCMYNKYLTKKEKVKVQAKEK